jgi:hypothetical protein
VLIETEDVAAEAEQIAISEHRRASQPLAVQ